MEKRNYKVLLFVFSCLLVCMLAFVGCSERVVKDDISSDNGALQITMGETNGISLAFAPSNASPLNSAYTKTLIATVSPSSASDKSVDWSVLWSQSQLDHTSRTSEPVTDYITVTPSSDGSTTATVECHKAFSGDDIWVVVTSRVGGFSATCTVTYVGYPSDFSIDTTGKTVENDSTWGKSMVKLSYGTVHSFDLVATNSISSADSSLCNFEGFYSIIGSGSRPGLVFTSTVYNSSGAVTSTEDSTVFSSSYSSTDADGVAVEGFQFVNGNVFLTYTFWIKDNKLYCKATLDPTSVSSVVVSGGPSGRREISFKQFVDNKIIYFPVTVQDSISGKSHLLNVQFVTTVNGVSLNAPSLVF